MPPETKTQTSVGLETPTQTVKRIKAAINPTVSANQIVEPVTPVQVPNPALPYIPKQTSQIVTNVTRDVNGFISAQTEEAKRLKEQQEAYAELAGGPNLSQLFKETQAQYGVTSDTFKELQDIQLQLTDMGTQNELQKSQIQNAAGQTIGQGQREVTQQDREAAIRSAGLAARASVVQGNIETATALAKDTVNIAFQDRQLKAQNLLNQINMLQNQVDEQTGQLLAQEARQYEQELASIKEVKDAVSTAIVNGATQAEITQMTDPTVDDGTKLALAQKITGRGATELRNLDIEATRANIANTYSQISDRNARLDLARQAMQLDIDKAQQQAMIEAGEEGKLNEAKAEKALGMLQSINELATHPGFSSAVGPNPLARTEYGAGFGILTGLFTGNKSDFKSEVDMLANTLTLENMDLLKGPATDKDVEIVAASMSKLKNMDVTEKQYASELERLRSAAQRIVDNIGVTPEQAQFYFGTDAETLSEVDAIYGGSGTSASTSLYNW